jgi:hypothetical protein
MDTKEVIVIPGSAHPVVLGRDDARQVVTWECGEHSGKVNAAPGVEHDPRALAIYQAGHARGVAQATRAYANKDQRPS